MYSFVVVRYTRECDEWDVDSALCFDWWTDNAGFAEPNVVPSIMSQYDAQQVAETYITAHPEDANNIAVVPAQELNETIHRVQQMAQE